MPPTIRPILPSDAPIYQQIRQTSLKEFPQFVGPSAELEASLPLPDLQSKLQTYPSTGTHPFGYFTDNTCAAVTALTQNQNPKYSHKIFIWGLYVLPQFRHQKIAFELMQHTLTFAKSLPNAKCATLQLTTTNTPALHLYQRLGFTLTGTEPKALFINNTFHDFHQMHLDFNAPI